jgi:hypothetical protein
VCPHEFFFAQHLPVEQPTPGSEENQHNPSKKRKTSPLLAAGRRGRTTKEVDDTV